MQNSPAEASSVNPDPQQQRAIEHVDGPMLVRAGAGTGKTTVLVSRVARLVEKQHAAASEILAITYTREAARQLLQRATSSIEAAMGPGAAEGLRASTFHACCYEILQRNHAGFDILDKENLWVLLRRELDQRRLPLRKFLKAANPAQFIGDFIEFIDRCNDELIDAAEYQKYVEKLRRKELPLPRVSSAKEAETIKDEEILSRCEEIGDVYTFVEQLLQKNNLGTYGSMIVRAVELLKAKPELLKQEQARTRFILIDEFQDCNLAQIEFTQLLAGNTANIFAVGDPDQGIYRFRGASSAAFDEFLARFPKAAITSLDENYRSTQAILKTAFAVITKNPDIGGGDSDAARKPLQSAREKKEPAQAASPEVVLAERNSQSAFDIAESIVRSQKDKNAAWSDFAVLYRNHAHRAEIAAELGSRGIPFVVTGIDLMETAPLRDLVALLRVLDSTGDDISLFRLVVMPQFGMDPKTLQQRMMIVEKSNLAGVIQGMPAGAALLKAVAGLRAALQPEKTKVSEMLKGCAKFLGSDPKQEEFARFTKFVDDWEKLGITETGKLPEFLKYLEYFAEAGGRLKVEERAEGDAVRLMTVHAAKGLEFKHVFVVRVVSVSFPVNHHPPLFEFPKELLRSRIEAYTENAKELHQQEERRLFYVAVTRARDTLSLHAKAAKGREAVPLTYLRELAAGSTEGPVVTKRDAVPIRVDIEAAAAAAVAIQPPWLALDAREWHRTATLSAYAIEMYTTCPLKYKLSQQWRLPAEPVANIQFGAAMHYVLSLFMRSVIAKRPISDEQVHVLFRKELAGARIENKLQYELYEREGTEQLTAFLKAYRNEPQLEVIGSEVEFEVDIAEVKLRGRIDRIDRIDRSHVEVIDYKTGKPKDEKYAKNSLQLAIYAIAAKRSWGYVPERLVLHSLENNSRVAITPNPKKLQETEETVKDVANSIRAGHFEAKPDFHCRWCGHFSVCPATEEKLYTIGSAETASN